MFSDTATVSYGFWLLSSFFYRYSVKERNGTRRATRRTKARARVRITRRARKAAAEQETTWQIKLSQRSRSIKRQVIFLLYCVVICLISFFQVFFVCRLYSKQSASALPVIVDPDPHITCEFMDGRDSFLSTARDRHWEFSSLRRAKFSTLALCYELHTQGSDKFVYTCNTCKNSNAKWHCSECEVIRRSFPFS